MYEMNKASMEFLHDFGNSNDISSQPTSTTFRTVLDVSSKNITSQSGTDKQSTENQKSDKSRLPLVWHRWRVCRDDVWLCGRLVIATIC